MGEGTLDTAFGLGPAEGGWVMLWVSWGDRHTKQASIWENYTIVQHLNKDLFSFSPTSDSRICL